MTARRAAALSPLNPESFRRDRHRTTEVQFLALDYKPCSPSEIACNAKHKLPTPTELTMKKPRIACMAIPSSLPRFEQCKDQASMGARFQLAVLQRRVWRPVPKLSEC
jgi:hypothetical protein